MTRTLRAAVVEGAGADPVLRELVTLPLAADEVLVRVMAAGICHTDVSVADGLMFADYPVILGHEVAGVVEEAGPAADGFRAGDRVVLAIDRHCGHCRHCEGGNPVLCEAGGKQRRWERAAYPGGGRVLQAVGGFAELTTAPVDALVRLPDDVPFELGAVAGCAVATGLGAATNVAGIRPGAAVAVIGAGGVGLCALLGAAICGSGVLVAVDPNPARRRRALEFGATATATPALDQLRVAAPSGFDVIIECAGRPGAVELAVEATRPGGTIVVLGAPPEGERFSVETLAFVVDQKRIVGCRQGAFRPNLDLPAWFELWRQGRLPLDRLVTSRLELSEIGEGFRRLRQGAGLRTVLFPNGRAH